MRIDDCTAPAWGTAAWGVVTAGGNGACGQLSGHLGHCVDDGRVGCAAAHHETVAGGIVACVEIEQVVAREVVVGCFGPCYSVGVRRAEKRAGEGFAGLGLDLHALDAQPLLALFAVGDDLLFGKEGVKQNLFGDGERLPEIFRQGTEADVDVVAVDVHVEIGAVEVELFGDLLRGHVARPLAQQVGRRRGDERLALLRRAGAEDEADAHDLEFRGAERVDRHAVRERAAEGFVERYVRRNGELRLFHRVER